MKRQVKILSLILVFALALSGCAGKAQNKPEEDKPEEVKEAKNDKFKAQMTFNGSSTLAPVISAISTQFIEDNTSWDQVDGSFPEENISIFVSAGGSGAGVKSVIEGTSDFGMLAREVKEEEKDKIKDMKEIKLGIDALTVSVNPENPIHEIKGDLNKEEIQKIFSGEFEKWSDIDPKLPEEEIVVVIRDLGGGAHSVFQKSIMGEAEVRKDAIQAPSMGALVAKIMENKNAIGYASFGMVNQNQGKLIPLKVDGVEATKENIVDGSYIISRPLIVVKEGEFNPAQKAFVDYLQSEEASQIIEEMGFVPVN